MKICKYCKCKSLINKEQVCTSMKTGFVGINIEAIPEHECIYFTNSNIVRGESNE